MGPINDVLASSDYPHVRVRLMAPGPARFDLSLSLTRETAEALRRQLAEVLAPDPDTGPRVVRIRSQALANSVEQLERYGDVPEDIVRVIEALDDVNDDRAHGRDSSHARAVFDRAVALIEWRDGDT